MDQGMDRAVADPVLVAVRGEAKGRPGVAGRAGGLWLPKTRMVRGY